MNGDDEQLDLDLEDEAVEPQQNLAPEPEPEKTPEQLEREEMKAQLADLKGKAALIDQFAPLLPTVKAALEKFSAPAPTPEKGADPAEMKRFGEHIQKTMLTGSPEEAAQMFFDAINNVSKQNVDREIARVGGPVTDKLGDFVISTYLTNKADENPGGKKTHDLAARELRSLITPEQKAALGAASPKQAHEWLESAYERAGGRVLFRSSKNAKPQDLAGGGSGGGNRGGSVPLVPGMTAAQAREQERLARMYWPDTGDGGPSDEGRKKREEMLKRMAAELAEAG